MTDHPRLIEVAFPLKQASLDSVHEKNVRHGHISTLHIWPARRPLAACRAALIATLLPDPGTEDARQELLERIGGRVVRKVEKKQQGGKMVEVVKEETEGGILHWGRENGADMDWFRAEIRKAYGGRAPRVLDPFAGGGAIPLEAMRLGCEATAIDINPVAWFILKCTLEYPQKLAGQLRPLPRFALESPEFMEGFFKGNGVKAKGQLQKKMESVQQGLFPPPDVDLAWHVRAWGWWVLQKARAELERFYPVVDGKPTVAYLWARTVTCKNCRAVVPLLKTRWLCKKENKRVLLTMEPNAERTGVVFGVLTGVPVASGNVAQRKENDKRLGEGTMSRSGVTCSCCGIITTTQDTQDFAQAGKLGQELVGVVVQTLDGYDFRMPVSIDGNSWAQCEAHLATLIARDPIGPLNEPIDPRRPSPNARGLSGLTRYGITTFLKVFNTRQQVALFTLANIMRELPRFLEAAGYDVEWNDAITDLLALLIGKIADYNSEFCTWNIGRQSFRDTFARFALPMTTDYAESNPIGNATGSFDSALEYLTKCIEHLQQASSGKSKIVLGSSEDKVDDHLDVVLTDPPYYDAIPYADISDFFYIWLRRAIGQRYPPQFEHQLVRKDREIIQHAGRMDGDNAAARQFYEDGMASSFGAVWQQLSPNGRLVVVFAHKHPDAWETLVNAIIRVGFVVTASWPIQTERVGKTAGGARLASSVWLVCKKRPEAARPGWDNLVMVEMRSNIHHRLTDYWNAGIRGPDFVWAGTGPALEAYSKHPVVKKANAPGEVMAVSEFLREVRRIVVDFVVGRVLTHNGDAAAVTGLDDLTTYYLLHRHDFGLADAPVGACILYAVSCGLSDSALVDRYDILIRTGGKASADEEEDDDEKEEADVEEEAGSGSRVKLKPWSQRKRKTLGNDVEGRSAALIDQAHRLMHLWKAGDLVKVDEYLDNCGLRRNALFQQLLQALIELSPASSEERSLLESISNHLAARGATKPAQPELFEGKLFAEPEG